MEDNTNLTAVETDRRLLEHIAEAEEDTELKNNNQLADVPSGILLRELLRREAEAKVERASSCNI